MHDHILVVCNDVGRFEPGGVYPADFLEEFPDDHDILFELLAGLDEKYPTCAPHIAMWVEGD